MKIANAPCSWGALEFDLEEKSEEIGFEQVLDEIKETGYIGTELGVYAHYPKPAKSRVGKKTFGSFGRLCPCSFG